MPKAKTCKGAKKRFALTGKGKIKRHRAGKGHLLGHKTRQRKRRLRRGVYVHTTDASAIKRLFPYS
jgi:large subunit ribosomal protein L35